LNTIGRAFAIVTIWVATSLAWLVLGGVMTSRVDDATRAMSSQVEGLWGRPQVQQAPTATVLPLDAEVPPSAAAAPLVDAAIGGAAAAPNPPVTLPPVSTRVDVTLGLDQRLKGLRWFSLYDVAIAGRWTYRNDGGEPARVRLAFTLPDVQGVFDDVRFVVDGAPLEVAPENGQLVHEVILEPGEEVALEAGYASRGLDAWRYAPTSGGVSVLRDFTLTMRTDFDAVDFPVGTLSPSARRDAGAGAGEELVWEFSRVVTGDGIGMTMPQRVQPGQLAAALSFSAPISLGFFFLVIAVLARLRGLDIHPINYVFVSGAFFAFHLLFAYSVDHLHVGVAFALASVTSVCMVTAYLRLVVSARFALVESAAAQLLYLVGFSLAHFLEGFTGLTVTVLSIATLFLLMMLTGRIRWSRVLAKAPPPPPPPAPFVGSPYELRPG
jgi:hypothetical protein